MSLVVNDLTGAFAIEDWPALFTGCNIEGIPPIGGCSCCDIGIADGGGGNRVDPMLPKPKLLLFDVFSPYKIQ